MHQPVADARREIDICDAAVERMGRIDREMRQAVELHVTPDGTKITPAGERLSCLDLEADQGHHVPPSLYSGDSWTRFSDEVKPVGGARHSASLALGPQDRGAFEDFDQPARP